MKDLSLPSSITMTSKEIAEITGKRHDHVLRDIDKLLKSLSPDLGAGFSMTYEGNPEHGYRLFNLDRDSSICLVAGYDANARMKIIKRWQALESGEATPAFEAKPKRKRASSQLSGKMLIARQVRSVLRISDTGYIGMVAKIAESEGIEPTFLPAYVDETLTKAMTGMLKDLDHRLATKVRGVVHPALEEMGILERLSRPSTTKPGKVSRFLSLTKDGLKYGRNETSPNNPRETQPLYYVDRFAALLDRLEAHLEGSSAKLALVQPSDDGGAA